jgi:hypothetical protein
MLADFASGHCIHNVENAFPGIGAATRVVVSGRQQYNPRTIGALGDNRIAVAETKFGKTACRVAYFPEQLR